MELCANRPLSNVPRSPYSRFPLTAANRRFKPSFHLKHSVSPLRGDVSRKHSSPRANISEETPSEMSKFDGDTSRIVVAEDEPPAEKRILNNSAQEDPRQDDSPLDEQMQPFGELFDKFSLKFPKLLEVVGLSYSLWFTTRYLIFKKNRDELGSMIEELKQQVLGSDED
ncbi:hypothetical protein V2J09_009150 [Rumex salicifolius]